MNKDELDELIQSYPTLFHMAEAGSWPSIATHGLLSTSALLDLYGIAGNQRAQIEEMRRPDSVKVKRDGLSEAVIRDQKPMDDSGLRKALKDGMTPRDWYLTLNQKVFFWLTRRRLLTLMNARPYREKAHDILFVDTRSLIEAHKDRVWLAPMNTGCTKPFPHSRGAATFRRIADYPYSERPVRERAVELAFDYAIPDIAKYVTRVARMRGEEELALIY